MYITTLFYKLACGFVTSPAFKNKPGGNILKLEDHAKEQIVVMKLIRYFLYLFLPLIFFPVKNPPCSS